MKLRRDYKTNDLASREYESNLWHTNLLCETFSYLYYFYCTYVIYHLHTFHFVPNKLLIVSSTLFETKAIPEIQMNTYSYINFIPIFQLNLTRLSRYRMKSWMSMIIECNEVRMIMIVRLYSKHSHLGSETN